jgi:hypothetical protein
VQQSAETITTHCSTLNTQELPPGQTAARPRRPESRCAKNLARGRRRTLIESRFNSPTIR